MPKIKILFFLVVFLSYFFLSISYYSGDIKNHLIWGQSIATSGPFGFYSRYFHDYAFPNYPPLAMTSFFLSVKVYEVIKSTSWVLNNSIGFFPSNIIPIIESNNFQIAVLKLPALVSTIIISWYIFFFAGLIKPSQPRLKKIIYPLFFLINPAILYITLIWGQIDLLPLVFLFPALYFLVEKKWVLSTIFISLMLLSKQTSLVFYFIYLCLAFKTWGLKKTIFSGVTTFLIMYLFYIPFLGINPLEMVSLYRANFEYVAKVTQINAINFWGYIYDFNAVSDDKLFNSITFNNWGYILFGIFYFPLLLYILKIKKTLEKNILYYKILFILFLTSMFYYLTLTRMHERYIIPAVVFAIFLSIVKTYHIFNLIFISLFSFLNLYRGLQMPDIKFLRKAVFALPFLGGLFISYLIISFYNISLFVRENLKKNG